MPEELGLAGSGGVVRGEIREGPGERGRIDELLGFLDEAGEKHGEGGGSDWRSSDEVNG